VISRSHRTGRLVAAAASLVLVIPPSLASAQQQSPGLTPSLTDALSFRAIGPANPSGRATAIAVPAGQSKTIYVGFASSGVWKTTNHGQTWKPVFDHEGSNTVGDVAVAPSDPKILWVGTGERNSLRSNSWGDGVYRSTDGGATWKHMGLTETREIGRIVIDPNDPETVYVAALGHLWGPNPERGIYKTTDGGENWKRVLFVDDTTGFVDLKMDPSDPNTLIAAAWHRLRWDGGKMEGAGAGSGIWKTTDGGATWTRLTDAAKDNGLPPNRIGRVGLAYSPSDPTNVYAVIQVSRSAFGPSISEHGGFFRSRDGGQTWTRVHDLSAVPDYYYNEVWVDPTNPERIYLGAMMVARSEDGGQTFEPQRWRNVHVDNHALWIDPADADHMILGNDGGVYITWDGGKAWEHEWIPAGQFYETEVDTTKVPYHVCGGLQDNGTWCGPSRTRERVGITPADWYSVWGGDGFHHQVSADDPRIRYGESQYGFWGRLNTQTMERRMLQPVAEDAGAESGYAFRFDWNTPFIISHHDPTTVYFGGNFLFRFTDRGNDWEILGPDMTRGNRFDPEPDSGHTAYRSLHSIAESTLTANVIWTGSNDGLIWVTKDGGRNWTNVTENIPDQRPTRCFVGEIEASSHAEGRAYVAYDCHRRDDYRPYVFRTDDYGATWTSITGDLPEGGGSWVVREDFRNPDLLFVGTERGLFASIDGGGHWVRMKQGLPTVPVKDMEIVRRTRELAVGTYGRSVYVLPISPLEELTGEVLASPAHLFEVLPARRFRYRSTYGSQGSRVYRAPNPPYGATITYYLRDDQDGDVKLTIRKKTGDDEKAETIRTLTGSGKAGIHHVRWDLTRAHPRARRLGESPRELNRALPGEYEVSLKVGDQTYRRTIEVEDGWIERTPGRMR